MGWKIIKHRKISAIEQALYNYFMKEMNSKYKYIDKEFGNYLKNEEEKKYINYRINHLFSAGFCDFKKKEIHITKKFPYWRYVLIHEVTHAILFVMEGKYWNEKYVDELAKTFIKPEFLPKLKRSKK